MGRDALAGNGRASFLWRVAQLVGLTAMLVLIAALLLGSETALTVLWNVLIPLVPASLLISPALWRNTCPLATLNMLPNGLAGRRQLTTVGARGYGAVGMVLLFVLVPARRFLFNTDALALAVVIIAVALLALVLGMVFDAKAGFCNAICPVLPVERLYGQRPLFSIGNARCASCTLCTRSGCIDLGPQKSIAQTLGRARQSRAWLLKPFGIFAAAFPGFVIGYYTTPDVPLAAAGGVYLHVLVWAALSYVVTAVAVRLLGLSSSVTLIVLAGAAVAFYYWFGAPVIAGALGVEGAGAGAGAGAGTASIRAAALGLVAVWLWRGLRRVDVANGPRAGSSVERRI